MSPKLRPHAQDLYSAAESILKQFEVPEDALRLGLASALRCLSAKWVCKLRPSRTDRKLSLFVESQTVVSLSDIADDLEGKS